MADRFLSEIKALHKLRAEIRALPDDMREVFMQRMAHAGQDWAFHARDAQLPPADLDWCWLLLGGRGFGKSHSLSAAVHIAVRAGISRMHLIAPTTADMHEVNLEGKSGILATAGRDPMPRWVSSRRRLEWPNGAVCVFFSGEEPDSLRGPQAEICLIDEIGRISDARFDPRSVVDHEHIVRGLFVDRINGDRDALYRHYKAAWLRVIPFDDSADVRRVCAAYAISLRPV